MIGVWTLRRVSLVIGLSSSPAFPSRWTHWPRLDRSARWMMSRATAETRNQIYNSLGRVDPIFTRRRYSRGMMKAARIHKFGPPTVIVVEELPQPAPGHGEVLVRVAAAGVGPWDGLIREHKSVVNVPFPLTLGSNLSGLI